MLRAYLPVLLIVLGLMGCSAAPVGTEPPPGGWANNAPTRVEQVIDRGDVQLLEVSQGRQRAWVQVPAVGAKIGDYVLLGQGRAQLDVELPEIGQRARELVEIAHIQVVDEATARRTVMARTPDGAVPIGTVYAELAQRADAEVVVYGTVVKATSVAGSVWVHIRDGSGDPAAGTHDLTIQASEPVTIGQSVAYRGVLRKDADIGFGYQFDALVEAATRVE